MNPTSRTKSSGKGRLTLLLFLLVFGAALAICLGRFRLETDLLAFVPGQERQEIALTRAILEGPLHRALVVNVVPKATSEEEDALRVAAELAAWMRKSEAFEQAQVGPSEDAEEQIFETYFPRRYSLLNEAAAVDFRSVDSLRARLRRTKTELATPLSSMYRGILGRDPLLLFPERAKNLSSMRPPGVLLLEGRYVAPDGAAYIFARVREGLGDAEAERGYEGLLKEFERLSKGGRLTLETSGAFPFEVVGAASTKRDLRRVGFVSALSVLLLGLLFFRGLRPLFLLSLPVLFGGAMGLCATLLVFGQVHGLALAFGASLIGVGVDYPLHLLAEQGRVGDGLFASVKRVRAGLLVGSGTTACGFVAFALTGSSVLKQVAVFSVVGLVSACAATLFLLPVLGGRGAVSSPIAWVAIRATSFFAVSVGRPRTLRFLLLVLSLGALGGAFVAKWATSTDAINPSSPEMRAADARVRARLGVEGAQIAVTGPNETVTLERDALLFQELLALKQTGAVGSVSALGHVVTPLDAQARARRLVGSDEAQRNLNQALAAEGFDVIAFEPLKASLETATPLTLEVLREGPLADMTASFFVETKARASVALSRVNADPKVLESIVRGGPGRFLFDPEEFLRQAFLALSSSLKQVVLVGGALMFLLVFARHRRFRPTLLSVAPAILSALGALGLSALAFGQLHVFHALAAVVVMSMGIDYAAFLGEGGSTAGENTAWASILLAATSTTASFSGLALSSMPALSALGFVIVIGIWLAVVFSWLFFAAMPGQPQEGSGVVPRSKSAPLAGALLVLMAAGCGGKAGAAPGADAPPKSETTGTRSSGFAPASPALSQREVTALLLSPQEIPRLFYRQKLNIERGPQTFTLKVVLQNDGDKFIVLGLGPAQTRLFVIEQTGQTVTYRSFVDREIPVSPERFLFELQAALFWTAPERRDPTDREVLWSKPGVCIQDSYGEQGILQRVILSDPDVAEKADCELDARRERLRPQESGPVKQADVVIIDYGAHGYQLRAPPRKLHLKDGLDGLTIAVQQLETGPPP